MKKLLFVLMIIAAGGTRSTAQSMLKVGLRDNTTQISVSLDDRHFNKRGTSITVGDLPYGVHYVKIFALEYDQRGRGFEEVIYKGRVKTYNGMITLLTFDPVADQASLQEMEIGAYTATHSSSTNGKFSGDVPSEQAAPVADVNMDNTQNGTNADGSPVASPIGPEKFGTLTDAKLNEIKKKVAAKPTDTQKMTILKDGVKDEKVTTNQVGDMMDWFIFESSKVEFAKLVYASTVDKEYFFDLATKFAYKASQEDLDKFLQGQK